MREIIFIQGNADYWIWYLFDGLVEADASLQTKHNNPIVLSFPNTTNNEGENYTPDGIKIPDGSIYGKDFNPVVLPLISNFNKQVIMPALKQYYQQQEYQKKLNQYKKDIDKYKKEKEKYDKKMREYKEATKSYLA